MRREGPSLAQLRLFVAVADAGSFSEAALDLDMSQSTVSHGVAALERLLGAQLLRRERHGAALTPLGEEVVVHARVVLHATEDIVRTAELGSAPPRGTLRVACIRSAGMHVLPLVLARMRREMPDVAVEVIDDEGAVVDGRADVGILNARANDTLLLWPLVHDDYVVLVPATSKLPSRLDWTHLTREPFIGANPKQACALELREYLERNGAHVTPTYIAEEDAVVLSMVAHGLGIAILPRLATQPLPPGVREADLPVPLARTIAVGVDPRRASSPLVRPFVRVAREAARDLAVNRAAQASL